MKKKDNKHDWDDGRVIASMDNVPDSFGKTNNDRRLRREVKDTVSKKERRAMVRGMFVAMLPRILAVLFGFGATVLLIWLWLM